MDNAAASGEGASTRSCRVLLDDPPFRREDPEAAWDRRGVWPASWLGVPAGWSAPFVVAYRCRFSLDRAVSVRIHVSADERYRLFLDGERIGEGPERGDRQHWHFESYQLSLAAGEHCLVGLVWCLGEEAPHAQVRVQPGFLLAAEEGWTETLNTGRAAWEFAPVPGYAFRRSEAAWLSGPRETLHAARYPWGIREGRGGAWRAAPPGHAAQSLLSGVACTRYQVLTPATLPAPIDRPWLQATVRYAATEADGCGSNAPIRETASDAALAAAWQRLWQGEELTVPAGARQRVLLDLDEYVCGYPGVQVSGGRGSTVGITVAESLVERLPRAGDDPNGLPKGDRGAVDGKFLCGTEDRLHADGGRNRAIETLWWRAGRYLGVTVETAGEPLILQRLSLRETRYPLAPDYHWQSSDARLAAVVPLMRRAVQACAHETYVDCPHYEQLMYAGDTRLEALATYLLTADDRLPRKALTFFDVSRVPEGFVHSCYPNGFAEQIIPSFSLAWALMLCDYAWWRDDPAFVQARLPGVRAALEAWLASRTRRGVARPAEGWMFVDWVREWSAGLPPGTPQRPCASANWFLVHALEEVARVEELIGEAELAARWRRQAGEVAAATRGEFWDADRRRYRESPEGPAASEHAQCLALLTDQLGPDETRALLRSLEKDADLHRTSIYFRHYLFEALARHRRTGGILMRMDLWFGLAAQGFRTTPERYEPARSDCHAWGAHPLYHYVASFLGLRPAAPGFRRVRCAPCLGPLAHVATRFPHPAGVIKAELRREGDRLRGHLDLPDSVEGEACAGDERQALRPGRNAVDLPAC